MPSVRDVELLLNEALEHHNLIRLILSSPAADLPDGPKKFSVRPVEVRGGRLWQWTEHLPRNERHSNLDALASRRRFLELFPGAFRHAHVFTATADVECRAQPDSMVKIRRRAPSQTAPAAVPHNRPKHRLLPEGRPCPFLERLGVMTPEGQVRAAQQHKFRQINRFLEFIDDVVPALPADGPLRIVDFGCGKSYLTFALHHLLHVVHGRTVELLGVDHNPDVVATCTALATDLGATGLTFQTARIETCALAPPVHLVISLHACDVGTDAALARAVQLEAGVILAAPCCQHEAAARMQPQALELLAEYGVLHDRVAAAATDALRAAALEAAGYRTQVLEFIDLEHTPKNVLLRAAQRASSTETSRRWWDRYQNLKRVLGLDRLAIETFAPWTGFDAEFAAPPKASSPGLAARDSHQPAEVARSDSAACVPSAPSDGGATGEMSTIAPCDVLTGPPGSDAPPRPF